MTPNRLHIAVFTIHGLVRSRELELGRDPDTGRRIIHAMEQARGLARRPEVARVDLFTRRIEDKVVSEDYAAGIEPMDGNLRIVRIQCGGLRYIRKELLWPHLDEYVDKTIRFIKRDGAVPNLFHGHHADGGYVAWQLSRFFGAPFLFTGHRMGPDMRRRLRDKGMADAEIERRFRLNHRIEVEDTLLRHANLVLAGSARDLETEYGRSAGPGADRFQVNPPGIDVDRFYPYYHVRMPHLETDEMERTAHASVQGELNRFLTHPAKPLILARCRPHKRDNIAGLIRAFGEDLPLRAMANLAIFAGIRKNISEMEADEREALTEMLLLMDKYDLYGKMAIPKKHCFQYEVPALCRIAAEHQGVFVDPVPTGDAGRPLLEAAACGLPVVAADRGEAAEIIEACENGILVDMEDPGAVAGAIKGIITDTDRWRQLSRNAVTNVRSVYTWEAHARRYLSRVGELGPVRAAATSLSAAAEESIGQRLVGLDHLLITDVDNTLIGPENPHLEELARLLRRGRRKMGFGAATGRGLEDVVGRFESHGLPMPDVVIARAGSEIFYGPRWHADPGWRRHISEKWDRERVREALSTLRFLKYQPESAQGPFKVSFRMSAGKDRFRKVHERLQAAGIRCTPVRAHGRYLDILPYRADKGKALRYLSYKWEIPLDHILACGNSAADEGMLRGETLGVVVAGHAPELDRLKGRNRIFFARKPYAGAIIEGLAHYRFPDNTRYDRVPEHRTADDHRPRPRRRPPADAGRAAYA